MAYFNVYKYDNYLLVSHTWDYVQHCKEPNKYIFCLRKIIVSKEFWLILR